MLFVPGKTSISLGFANGTGEVQYHLFFFLIPSFSLRMCHLHLNATLIQAAVLSPLNVIIMFLGFVTIETCSMNMQIQSK